MLRAYSTPLRGASRLAWFEPILATSNAFVATAGVNAAGFGVGAIEEGEVDESDREAVGSDRGKARDAERPASGRVSTVSALAQLECVPSRVSMVRVWGSDGRLTSILVAPI